MTAPVTGNLLSRKVGKLTIVIAFVVVILLALMIGSFAYFGIESRKYSDQSSLIREGQLLVQGMVGAGYTQITEVGSADSDMQVYIRSFDNTLATLRNGDAAKGITALPTNLVSYVEAVDKQWQRAQLTLNNLATDTITGQSLETYVRQRGAALNDALKPVIRAANVLEQTLKSQREQADRAFYLGLGSGLLLLLGIAALGYIFWRDSRRQLALSAEQNRRNQRAILRLLDEMTTLADGDLTIQATVSEDITGAIADSVNYAIDALRSLVININDSSALVSSESSSALAASRQLTEAANIQVKEIAATSSSISAMADAMTRMATHANESADVAMRSVAIAGKGTEAVRRNIEGMDVIRDQIQETAKRVKRLGESSQEIGDIVALINEIADRTNMLALNAAIQASTSGEAGRGFAVVADEIQRLAERVGDATRQVEVLVRTIQADASEAVSSMEQSTAGVVSGVQLVTNATEALAEIERVSKELAGMIQGISGDAGRQAQIANTLSDKMSLIREVTDQTTEGTHQAAGTIRKLNDISAELSTSVREFKLPGKR